MTKIHKPDLLNVLLLELGGSKFFHFQKKKKKIDHVIELIYTRTRFVTNGSLVAQRESCFRLFGPRIINWRKLLANYYKDQRRTSSQRVTFFFFFFFFYGQPASNKTSSRSGLTLKTHHNPPIPLSTTDYSSSHLRNSRHW